MILLDEKDKLLLNKSNISFRADSTLDTSPVRTSEPLNLSIKPISTLAASVATSAAIITASLGVIVKIIYELCLE